MSQKLPQNMFKPEVPRILNLNFKNLFRLHIYVIVSSWKMGTFKIREKVSYQQNLVKYEVDRCSLSMLQMFLDLWGYIQANIKSKMHLLHLPYQTS